MRNSYPIAVTGKLAAGKTAVCTALRRLGERHGIEVTVVDTDALRSRILEDRTDERHFEVQERLLSYFGFEIRSSGGGVDARRLSDITYYDKEAGSLLENIICPLLESEVERRLHETRGIALLEWSLVVEQNCLKHADYNVLLVSCASDERFRRITGGGGGFPLLHVLDRMEAQLSDDEKTERIRKQQREIGRGDLYLFDTTGSNSNPKALFDAIRINALLRLGIGNLAEIHSSAG